jgi:hypothetical protein
MIWILLAALGVPLWLIAGALIGGLLSRRSFRRAPGVFKSKVRVRQGEVHGLDDSWPRVPGYGRWVHDVLIVHTGLALVRNTVYPVASRTVSFAPSDPTPSHLGAAPLAAQLTLDDGAVIEVAVPREAITTPVEQQIAPAERI